MLDFLKFNLCYSQHRCLSQWMSSTMLEEQEPTLLTISVKRATIPRGVVQRSVQSRGAIPPQFSIGLETFNASTSPTVCRDVHHALPSVHLTRRHRHHRRTAGCAWMPFAPVSGGVTKGTRLSRAMRDNSTGSARAGMRTRLRSARLPGRPPVSQTWGTR